MRNKSISVRLTSDLAEWLDATSRKTGIPKGKIVREQLEKARASTNERPFMRLAGSITDGPPDLSTRKIGVLK